MRSISLRRSLFLIWSLIIPKVSGQRAADWMSGNHGIGFRIPGGVNIETCLYDVGVLVNQIKENIPEITWVLLGLSSGAYGDQYTSPHSILTDLNRASTPRLLSQSQWMEINYPVVRDFDLENYPERDLFSEIADAFHAEGFKVIAYMASQGPTFLKHGERRAYDYNNKSVYVNSVAECEVLTGGTITDGLCSPSARRWKNYVYDEYGADDDLTLQNAWAEKILGEYVKKFDGKEGRSLIDAWWFDQGKYMNVPLAHSIIMAANPNAIIAFNKGQKVPLLNNNPPFEQFTGGHPNPIIHLPPYDDANEAIIQSIENTADGYFESEGSYSLGHAFQMTNNNWNHGSIVWDGERMPKAIDWMSRVITAKGAWTWNVKRNFYPYYLHPDDVALVKAIIAGMDHTAAPTTSPTESPTRITAAPTTSPTESPTRKPCSEYSFLKVCKKANCSWDKESNTCSDPCSSYTSLKSCRAADCVWNKKLNTCSEIKLCSQYNKKQCTNNDCYWDSIVKICSSTKPCQDYKKMKSCPKDICVWKSKKCSTFTPCSMHKLQKKCKKNACYWSKEKKQCYDTEPCWVFKKKKTCEENDCSWKRKAKSCV